MRKLAVIVSLVLCLVSLAEKAALSKDTSIVLELGAAKVSGDLYEDTTYRMISGIGVFIYGNESYSAWISGEICKMDSR